MIPKGLIIAVGTGIVAAAALGIYLQNTSYKNLEFVIGPSISVFIEKQDYKTGESIPIEIINSGTTNLAFPEDLPSLQVRALDGTVFFSTSFDGELIPTQIHVYEWDQLKNDGTKISGGSYVIDIVAYDNNQKISDSVTVNILK